MEAVWHNGKKLVFSFASDSVQIPAVAHSSETLANFLFSLSLSFLIYKVQLLIPIMPGQDKN